MIGSRISGDSGWVRHQHLGDVLWHRRDKLRPKLKHGVPKELARCIMPVGHYSRMRASANLRNWMSFLSLRQAPNAQWEIRQYADSLNTILTPRFPRSMGLFNNGGPT